MISGALPMQLEASQPINQLEGVEVDTGRVWTARLDGEIRRDADADLCSGQPSRVQGLPTWLLDGAD